jgi:ubiquinone/menaquinone biosynthesis C-methylase UbiE
MQIKLLEQVSLWQWDIFGDRFNRKLLELNKFIEHNNKLPSQHSKQLLEKTLGAWCVCKKQNYKYGILANEQIKQLEKIPHWKWTNDNQFYINYTNFKAWVNNNNKTPSSESNDKNEKFLGSWAMTLRKLYRQSRLSVERIKELEKLTYWYWDKDHFNDNFERLQCFIEKYNKLPSCQSKNMQEKKISTWCSDIRYKYRTNKLSNEQVKQFDTLLIWRWNVLDEKFYEIYYSLREWINNNNRIPCVNKSIPEETYLGQWCATRRKEYRQNRLSLEKIKLLTNIPHWYWSKEEKSKKSIVNTKPINKEPKETKQQKQHRIKSKISELHKEYKTLKSANLHKRFNDNPELWTDYHKISEYNELSFEEQDELPYKRIIKYLEQFNPTRLKHVGDLGCGTARVYEHFKNNDKYKFYNYDHYSCNDNVTSCDISSLPLNDRELDIVILCLSMWGSNCHSYIDEVYRCLETNGILLIIEPCKRWMDDETNKLMNLLESKQFHIKKEHNHDKFMFIECVRL